MEKRGGKGEMGVERREESPSPRTPLPTPFPFPSSSLFFILNLLSTKQRLILKFDY